jgi:hypothetical protein
MVDAPSPKWGGVMGRLGRVYSSFFAQSRRFPANHKIETEVIPNKIGVLTTKFVGCLENCLLFWNTQKHIQVPVEPDLLLSLA